MLKPCAWSLVIAILAASSPLYAADAAAAKKESKFDKQIKDKTKIEGMWTMYHKDQKLLVDLKASDLGKEYLISTSIAKGIGVGSVLGGMSWGFGDDALWTFKKVGDKIHVIRRNVRYKASKKGPTADALKLAFSDSVLYALPILDTDRSSHLVDVSKIFMSDDAGIGRSIGYAFASDRSTWEKVKAFEKNVELRVAAVYQGRGTSDAIVDPRGVTVQVHHSISELGKSDYKPRLADDRVGYFTTVIKDFSSDEDEHFIRYINRWNLQKEDDKGPTSVPKKQITFFIEETVPHRWLPYVLEGFKEWNKAFEKLGYYEAINVRRQGEAGFDFDPEDIRYNTFRWITAEAGFAMGPSRVNPKTGEILDADIIFDADFLKYWSTKYETFSSNDVAMMMGGDPLTNEELPIGQFLNQRHKSAAQPHELTQHRHLPGQGCSLCNGLQHQMGFSAAVLMSRTGAVKKGELPEEFIGQALKEVVMHEVGHTLGLRHNFKASAWKTLEEINDPEKGAAEGTVSSVMDYTPANIVPKGQKQGLYFPQTIGPYDYWAIEYGYSDKKGDELKAVAARSTEPALDFATDEDTRSYDSDPLSNRFDLGKDPLEFAQRQMATAASLWPEVVETTVEDGEGYQRARQAFGMLFSEYWRTAYFAARFPGGVYVNRDHKGSKDARAPYELVEPERQRAAMKLLAESAFSTQNFPPEILNYLAATRWNHWGVRNYIRLDYPIHEFVAMMQSRILYRLLHQITLARLLDSELKVPEGADVYTLAEHLRTLVQACFSEWQPQEAGGEFTNRKPYISSFRRNLQRLAVKQFADVVNMPGTSMWTLTSPFRLSGVDMPEDARTLARLHLADLDRQITAVLGKENLKLDDYSRAHLQDCQERIRKTLNSQVQIRSVD
ncbi:zinc-dependent metalloprotease [Symmachiella dynata]|uniref:zinc-dependent metalloprotease n=1 Tax=Symmachiella dynata TaxID=2527995 RepID=UPI0030EE3A4A